MRLMKLNLILATDLLSRGVDLPDVKLVINFDLPLTSAEFFHRIGRSGRFGAQGTAISLLTEHDLNSLPYLQTLLPTMTLSTEYHPNPNNSSSLLVD
jgi:superfamily II DNA/RNA helicase